MEEQVNADEILKDAIPAKLDFWQSATGVILGLFIWVHLLFDSSILLGPNAMYVVSKGLEGNFLDPAGHGWPILVSLFALGIFGVFVVHAGLAMRKFPANWRMFKAYYFHMTHIHHEDTSQWFLQAVTGFIMFFFGSTHLLYMVFFPNTIDPYSTADRVFSQGMFFFYIILLFAVVLHAAIGLYRVSIKWGLFGNSNPRAMRKTVKTLMRTVSGVFLVLGVLALLAYGKLGYEHKDKQGERFDPALHGEEVHP